MDYAEWAIDKGSTVKAEYLVQNILHPTSNDVVHQEVLSRPTSLGEHSCLEDFFEKMSPQDQIDWLADQLRSVVPQTGTTLAINLSANCLNEPTHRDQVRQLLVQHSEPVIIEITEGSPLPEPSVLNPFFYELRKLGHQFALDDFGAGFNHQLSLISDYDFDIVKIDRSLTWAMDKPQVRSHLRLLAQILNFAGKSSVAEGIETQEQLDQLNKIGFKLFQGYFLHRPEPAKKRAHNVA